MTPQEKARRLVADSLERDLEEVPPDGTLETVPGWDSLGHLRIILAVEEALGRSLQGAEIAAIAGIADLTLLLAAPADR